MERIRDRKAALEQGDLTRAEGLGQGPPRHRPLRRFLLAAGVITLIYVAVTNRPEPPPLVEPDCTRAALHLPGTEMRRGTPLQFTVVGPADDVFVLAVDTRDLETTDDNRPVPRVDGAQAYRSKPVATTGCRGTGRLGLPLPAGGHVLTLYRLEGSAAVEVSTTEITLTER